MTVNQSEYQPQVGLDSLHVALVTQDDAAGYVADTPEVFAPAVNATSEPTTGQETFYADNQPFVALTSEGETKITLDISNIPISILAKYLGKTFDATTGRMYDAGGGAVPPDCALSFRSEKSNGKQRYFQYLKGKFSVPNDDASTIKDKKEAKPSKIIFTAINTVHQFDVGAGVLKAIKRIVGDEDTDAFSATGWFTQVQVPGVVAPSALALSSSDPIDGATAVAVNKTITLTFNNALLAGAIYGVVVVKADGTPVTTVNSLDTTKKIMTVDPTADLTAASTYIVTYGVTDIYGQTLQGAINFATA